MNWIRKHIDRIKPNFEKGGKLEKLGSTFEAFETFLFVPDKVTNKGSHIRDAIDMKRTMALVVMAMIPCLFFGIWNVGSMHFAGQDVTLWQQIWFGILKVMPIVVVSYTTGLGIEFVFAQYRGHEVNEGFLVTGILIPLIIPVTTPLWMVVLATAFAVIIGKEVFGGTGMNILNPALTARAFLFFAYPQNMSGDKVWIAEQADAISGATPLANAAAGNMDQMPSTMEMFIGTISGSIGETSTLAILIGAAILIFTGIGSARIIIATFIGGLIMGGIFNLVALNDFMKIPAWDQLMLGGFAFGAVFMATDPVTATQTARGKIIYGFCIGMLGILIRVVNPAYPEGMMLAILFMNVFAPTIDHYVVEGNIKKRLKRMEINT